MTGRRTLMILVTLACLSLLGAAAVAVVASVAQPDPSAEQESVEPASVGTAPAVVVDQSSSLDASLVYADARTITHRLTGAAPEPSTGQSVDPATGPAATVVTSLPEIGSIIDPGEVLYETTEGPVLSMLGDMPAYRTIGWGDEGDDVGQLEAGLVAGGTANDVLVDGVYEASTGAAISRWRIELGLSGTTEVELGRVVFVPGPVRVVDHGVEIGAVLTDDVPVLSITSIDRMVKATITEDLPPGLAVGLELSVELPDRTRLPAEVTSFVATTEGVEIEVGLEVGDASISDLDELPVRLDWSTEIEIVGPVVDATAIVALEGGRHGVRVLGDDDDVQLVEVEIGAISDRLVEVIGIETGTRVVTP